MQDVYRVVRFLVKGLYIVSDKEAVGVEREDFLGVWFLASGSDSCKGFARVLHVMGGAQKAWV